MGIKPQDILILLKIIAMGQRPWRQVELADELAISRAEVSNSLGRCYQVGLIDESKRTPHKVALLEFIQYGLKYVFAVKPGPMVRGILTAHAAPPLASHIVSDQSEVYVWPWPEGEARGQAVEPLYPTVPKVIKNAPVLYEMLALVDALRLGRIREQKIALEELKIRIMRDK